MALIKTSAANDSEGNDGYCYRKTKSADTPTNRTIEAFILIFVDVRWTLYHFEYMRKELGLKAWRDASHDRIKEYFLSQFHPGDEKVVGTARALAFDVINNHDKDEADTGWLMTRVEAAQLLLELIPTPADLTKLKMRQRLTERQWTIWQMSKYEALATATIANRLGITKRAVSKDLGVALGLASDLQLR